MNLSKMHKFYSIKDNSSLSKMRKGSDMEAYRYRESNKPYEEMPTAAEGKLGKRSNILFVNI